MTQLTSNNDQGPRINQRYGHVNDYGFDFDIKEVAIPLEGLSDKSSSGNAYSRSNPVNAVEYTNAQMGLKWQPCE